MSVLTGGCRGRYGAEGCIHPALLAIACDTANTPTQLTGLDGPAAVPDLSVLKVPIEETLTLSEPNCAGEMLEVHFRQQLVTQGVFDANGGSHFYGSPTTAAVHIRACRPDLLLTTCSGSGS